MGNHQYIRLVLVLGLALLVRLIFFHGFLPSDPYDYSVAAAAFSSGNVDGFDSVASTRFGLIVPVALIYFLFGVSEYSSALWPILCSLGTVGIGFACGRYLGGERAGIIAAVLLALFPLDIIYGTQFMADVPLGFWLFASLFLFIRGADASQPSDRWKCFFGSGMAVGLAYATKSVALMIAPFFAICGLAMLVRDRKFPWSLAYVVAGLLSVAVLEMLFFFLTTGDTVQRFSTLSPAVDSRTQVIVGGGEEIALSLFDYLKWMFIDIRYTGPVFVILLVVSLAGLTRPTVRAKLRGARIGLLLLWAAVMFLVLNFYPLSISPYVPVYKLNNYMLMFAAPLIVCLALLLSRLSRMTQFACIAIVAIAAPFSLYVSLESHRSHSENARQVHEFAGSIGDSRIMAEGYGISTFRYLDGLGPGDRYEDFTLSGPAVVPRSPVAPSDIHDTFIVIDRYFLDYYGQRGFDYPEFIHEPLTSWEVAFRYTRTENPVRRIGLDLLATLYERRLLSSGQYQRISAKLRNWSHTTPVTVYYAR